MATAQILWGCAAAVVLSTIQSLGVTLQRKSHVLKDDHDDSKRGHTYRRNLWLVGFLLFVTANVFGLLVQLTTLPLIVLSPLQSIGLIANSILSCVLLGERFTRKLAVGTLVIGVGAFIIAYNGGVTVEPPKGISTDERFSIVLAKLRRPPFAAWCVCTFAAIVLLARVNALLTTRVRVLSRGRPRRKATQRISTYNFAKGVLYGVMSGTLTAHTFLLAKSIVDVMVEMVLERSTPKSLGTYATTALFVCAMLAIVALQLVAFNLGLAHISSSVLYPLCFLVFNLVNLFNDLLFNALLSSGLVSAAQLVWVVVGLAQVLFGVVTISWDGAVGGAAGGAAEETWMNSTFPYDSNDNEPLIYEECELYGQVQLK